MRHPVPPPAVRRARLLVLGLFALTGVTFSCWLSRIPTIRDSLDLSTAELGGVLLVGSVGALSTVTVAGVVVERFGSRAGLVLSTGVMAVGYVLAGLGPTVGSVPLLAVGVFLNGVAAALSNMPINVESARIERAMGRTVIPQFHAAFSLGTVAGSALGALASRLGVPVLAQLTAVAALAVVWRLASLRGAVLPPTAVESAGAAVRARAVRAPAGPGGRRRRIATALDAWREPRTLLVGTVVLAAALSEGSANDWVGLAVVDGFGAPEATGSLVLGVFVAGMTTVRLLGTRLIDWYGRVRVLRTSGLVSLGGLLLFGTAPALPLAAVGVAAWGFGAALAIPVGIAAASDDPVRAPGRVAVVSSFASMAQLAAPPLLGLAAEGLGARHALLLITVAMLVSVSLSRWVARERPVAPPDEQAGMLDEVPAPRPVPVAHPQEIA